MKVFAYVFVLALLLQACATAPPPPVYPAGAVTEPPIARAGPADPLTAAERDRAVEIARRVLSERGVLRPEAARLVGVELANAKIGALTERDVTPADIRRQALVIFFRYDVNEGLLALVDLLDGSVAATETAPAQAVPIGAEEVQAAATLALASERVRAILGDTSVYRVPASRADLEGNTVEGLRVLGADERDPCFRNRCIDLFFRRGGRYIVGQRVTVDLTAQQVYVATDEGVRP